MEFDSRRIIFHTGMARGYQGCALGTRLPYDLRMFRLMIRFLSHGYIVGNMCG
jgi:hypothetical protein